MLLELSTMMKLHQLTPVDRRPPGWLYLWWIQWFTQMRQDPPDRSRVGDEADQPDIAATVGTRQRKLLTHPCQ